ncbi:MAG: hypothetical protein ABH950_01495 [Candidatus Altiarchaeota archaeon]
MGDATKPVQGRVWITPHEIGRIQPKGIVGARQYFVVDKETGRIIERLSLSGKRVLREGADMTLQKGGKRDLAHPGKIIGESDKETGKVLHEGRSRLTNQEILRGVSEGRLAVVTQKELIAGLDKSRCGIGMTGGGDSAGIADCLASFSHHLDPGLFPLGVKNGPKGLIVPPNQFEQGLILVDDLLAEDFRGQSSTPFGSARGNPFRAAPQNTKDNIRPFQFFYGIGGNDHLAILENASREFPDMVIVGTFKSIDGDGCLKVNLFNLENEKVDVREVGKAFKLLGLSEKVKGKFNSEGVEFNEGNSEKRWILRTDKGQKWVFVHKKGGKELRIFEEVDSNALPKRVRERAGLDEKPLAPTLRRTLESEVVNNGKIVTCADIPTQMLGFDTAVEFYQRSIWAVIQNAATHNQVHVVETFGRGAARLAFEAVRKFPPNFNELPPEERRKITDYRDLAMILAPEKPTTFRSLASHAKEIKKEMEG